MVKNKRINSVLSVLFTSIILLSLFQNTNLIYAQGNANSHSVPTRFKMLELGEDLGQLVNTSSIILLLPSATWNISEIELNFTDIRLNREQKVIEDQEFYGEKFIYYNSPGQKRLQLGVQLNIPETTTLYGVYIYGHKVVGTVTDIKFQINGYDEITNLPNGTIYRQIDLNISDTEGWYYQDFSNGDYPIILTKGNYSLVMNGTDIRDASDHNSIYYWKHNEVNPVTPTLYISEYINSWVNPKVNSTYLHKLVQKTDKIYWPEDIKMQVGINGQDYNISNGLSEGSGNLTVTDLNFSNGFNFEIPIKSNQDIQLIFNLSYRINTEEFLISDGIVKIRENLPNSWSIYFDTDRYFYKHMIKFYYPRSWQNLSISRDIGMGWENISLDISIDEINNIVTIPNENITDGADWEITANSPNIELNLDFPILEWEPGQELQFSVPIVEGNITFFITNPLDFRFEESIDLIEITSVETFFSYIIPSSSREGTYILEIYWNNATDAGVQSQEFQVTIPPVPFTIDPMLIVIIVGAIAFVSVVSFTTYKVAKNVKRKHKEYSQIIFNKYVDVLNLEYFIIIHKKSGLNVYEQILASKTIDPSLISGFLEAIRTFGIELTSADEQSQTIKLEYHKSKILMSEFKSFRILLILKENPSHDFLESIKELSYDIDNKYGNLIENFKGNISNFTGIKDLLEQHLQTSLIYPLQIVKKDVKLKSDEKSMVNRAKTIMKRNNMNYFIVTNLLSVRKEFDAKDAETILNLIKKKIFQPKA